MANNFGNPNVPDDEDDDDSDDVDYVPSEHDSSVSDVEAGDSSDGEAGGGESEEEKTRKGVSKRKADSPDSSPRKKTAGIEDSEKANAIWEQFKMSVKEHKSSINSPEKKLPEETKKEETSPSENIKQPSPQTINVTSKPTSDKKTATPSSSLSIGAQIKTTTQLATSTTSKQVFQQVGKPVISPSSSRLSSLLSQIGPQKKSKNMLEQSREHWEEFKNSEGISDELALHNRGTKGYLDRQDFLARVDSRQSEQLREMRLQLMNKRRTT